MVGEVVVVGMIFVFERVHGIVVIQDRRTREEGVGPAEISAAGHHYWRTKAKGGRTETARHGLLVPQRHATETGNEAVVSDQCIVALLLNDLHAVRLVRV